MRKVCTFIVRGLGEGSPPTSVLIERERSHVENLESTN
jgi:hypothetical protein